MPLLSELQQTSQDLFHNRRYNGLNPGTFVVILRKVAFFSAPTLYVYSFCLPVKDNAEHFLILESYGGQLKANLGPAGVSKLRTKKTASQKSGVRAQEKKRVCGQELIVSTNKKQLPQNNINRFF